MKELLQVCFHCKKNKSNTLCNDCRFNKNIMATATDIKKTYKILEEDIDIDEIYHENYTTSYKTIGTSYYLPDFYKYVKNILIEKIDKNNKKYSKIKKALEKINQIENEEENKKNNYNIVIENIRLGLKKYNISELFIETNEMKTLIDKKLDELTNKYNFNLDFYVIQILDNIEFYHNRKIEIDNRIENEVNEKYKENVKQKELYFSYIFDNDKYINLNKTMEYILKEQEKDLYKNAREEKMNKLLKDIENKLGYSLRLFSFILNKYKSEYVNNNIISYDECKKKMENEIYCEFKKRKLIELSKNIGKIVNIDTYEYLIKKYKNEKIIDAKEFSKKIKSDGKNIKINLEEIEMNLNKIISENMIDKTYLNSIIYFFDTDIKNYIFDVNDIFIDKIFLKDENNFIIGNLKKCVVNIIYDVSYEKEIVGIENRILNLNKYIKDYKEKINYPKEFLEYCSKFCLVHDYKIAFIIETELNNKNMSSDEMIKYLKEYYFENMSFLKIELKQMKEKFKETSIYINFLNDNNVGPKQIMNLFEKYRRGYNK